MMPSHPLQPLVRVNRIVRFKRNAIIDWLFNTGRLDLHPIAQQKFSAEDQQQLAQLLGYSLGGYSELDYVTDEAYERAAAQPIEEE